MIFRNQRNKGFTLVEAIVAFAILVIATVGMIWSRTKAIEQATEARNLKIAVKIALETLDFLKAGLNQEEVLDLNEWREVEGLPGYYVRIISGEDEISIYESTRAEASDDEILLKRLNFEERLKLERDLENQQRYDQGVNQTQNEEEETIDEETFKEVIIVVRYPSTDFKKYPDGIGEYALRVKLSTLALSGLTPEEAEERKDLNKGQTNKGGGK